MKSDINVVCEVCRHRCKQFSWAILENCPNISVPPGITGFVGSGKNTIRRRKIAKKP